MLKIGMALELGREEVITTKSTKNTEGGKMCFVFFCDLCG